MVIPTLATAAAGYIVKSLTDSEGAKTAGKELSTALWQWVRPLFLKDAPDVVAKVETATPADVPTAEKALAEALQAKAANDPAFAQTLQQHLNGIQNAGAGAVFNFGNVEKQVNNPTIQGDFNM